MEEKCKGGGLTRKAVWSLQLHLDGLKGLQARAYRAEKKVSLIQTGDDWGWLRYLGTHMERKGWIFGAFSS